MACSMTWAHQDSPLRATNAAAASRLGSASAARIRGSWKSSGAGSTTSSITSPSINHVASSSIDVVLFDGHRTSMFFELQGVLVVNAVSRAVNSLAAVRAGASSASAPGPDPRRWLMLPVVLMAMFMAGFAILALDVAPPSLQRHPHVSGPALPRTV